MDAEAVEVVEIGAVWALEVLFLVIDVFAEADAVQKLKVNDIRLLRDCCFSLVRLQMLNLVDHFFVVLLLLNLVVGYFRLDDC